MSRQFGAKIIIKYVTLNHKHIYYKINYLTSSVIVHIWKRDYVSQSLWIELIKWLARSDWLNTKYLLYNYYSNNLKL